MVTGSVGAGTGIAALRVSRRSARAARDAADSTAEVARIEGDRQHRALEPRLRFAFTVWHGEPARPGARARLVVTLDGPLDLDGLAVAIRDDRPDRAPGIAGGPTAADIAATVWGPWRLFPGVPGGSRDGRAVPARPLRRREQTVFALEAVPVPHWVDRDRWAREHADAPLRLAITGTRGGYRPWVLHEDVHPEPAAPRHAG